MTERTRRLAIIGAGAMGQTLARGLIAAGVYSPREIVATDVDKARLAAFAEETGVDAAGNVEAAANSGVVILSVRPPVIPEVLDDITTYVGPEQVIISIAAGVTIRQIESKLRPEVAVIRAMPNTPCLVGLGATAISRGRSAEDVHIERAMAVFGAVGKVIEVPERLLNAVTGLSGSGPAFTYIVIEALADGGVKAGLTRQQAALLAAQTVLGAAKMVLETGKHTGELRDAVASPGGTAIAGISALEHGGLRAAVIDAVWRAAERSREMSERSESIE